MTLTLNHPPATAVEHVIEILHGVAVTDPYRWLEEQNSPQTRQWLEQQAVYTQSYFDTLSGQERIRKRLEELLDVEVIKHPYRVGNRCFFLMRAAHQEQPLIMIREGESKEGMPLVDPAQRGQGNRVAVDILNISRDGNILAYGVREGGDDCQSIEFVNVDRREVLADRIPAGRYTCLVFSSDGQGIFYSHEPVTSLQPDYRAVYRHLFGTSSDEDVEVFSAGTGRNLHVFVGGSDDCKYLSYCVVRYVDPPLTDFYVQDLSSKIPPQLVVEKESALFSPVLFKDRLITLTDWQAPNRRVMSIDLKAPERQNWREIVRESKRLIQNIIPTDKYILVNYTESMGARIEIVDWDGRNIGMLPSSPHGTATALSCSSDGDSVFYSFSSFRDPPEIRQYHFESGKEEIWAYSQVPFDPSSIEVEQVSYSSKDGTRIPMFLVRPKEYGCAHPLPTVIYGYGGFGTCITPQFAAYVAFLVEHRCLVAFPNIRGGGEYGEEWHLAGKRRNRQNAIDDFIVAAEWLLSKGYSVPGKVGIVGGSNGALLVGASITQRPDLFRAAICLGPLLDMLRYHRFDSTDSWVGEYGSADSSDDFAYLHAYSPYHRVTDGSAYPAVMLISGDADTRCNPLHARKMTARLQSASISGHPILLEYKPAWGHWPTQALSCRVDALTRRLGFLCHELGISY